MKRLLLSVDCGDNFMVHVIHPNSPICAGFFFFLYQLHISLKNKGTEGNLCTCWLCTVTSLGVMVPEVSARVLTHQVVQT